MLFRWFFASLLLLLIIVSLLFTSSETSFLQESVHPQFSTMMHSGDPSLATGVVQWSQFFLGCGVIMIFGLCLMISVRKSDRSQTRRFRSLTTIGIFIYIIIYTMVVYLDRIDHMQPLQVLWAFPRASAWMLFPLSLIPIVFTLMYVFGFNQWIISPKEEQAFHEILAGQPSAGSP